MRLRSRNTVLKASITGLALGVVAIRVLFPNLRLDGVDLGLLALAVLPWLAPLVKSAEFPGGWKIEFQDVQEAMERATGSVTHELRSTDEGVGLESATVGITAEDPSLALVGLRIDIEKRLRRLADQYGISPARSLPSITRELQSRHLLETDVAAGLRDLISFGNQAAHGVEVSPAAALSALRYGPKVLAVLDKIASGR